MCVFYFQLRNPQRNNIPQIIVEVLLSLVLGIVGANFGNDLELKDISWRTEMRKRCSSYDLPTAPDALTCIAGPSNR